MMPMNMIVHHYSLLQEAQIIFCVPQFVHPCSIPFILYFGQQTAFSLGTLSNLPYGSSGPDNPMVLGSFFKILNLKLFFQHVDLENSYLCGYLKIKGLTEEYPTLTTFFDGEIISKKHPFLTRKWDADEDVDRKHWVCLPLIFYKGTFINDVSNLNNFWSHPYTQTS